MHLYLIAEGGWYKIGITSKSVAGRLRQLQSGNRRKLRLAAYVETEGAADLERSILALAKRADARGRGEWIKPGAFADQLHAAIRGGLPAVLMLVGTNRAELLKPAGGRLGAARQWCDRRELCDLPA